MHQSKKRKSSVSSVSHPFDGPPSPAPSAASSSAASSSQLPQASGATEGSSSSGGRAGSAAPSASHGSGGHPTVGGGVGELIGTGTGPGDVNEPGISMSESRRRARVLRNRESAQRSRDAKKNHQQELEVRVAELEAQLAAALNGSSVPSSSSAPPDPSATTTATGTGARDPPNTISSRLPTPPPTSVKPPSPVDDGSVRRLALEKENVDLRARVGKLEELVRGLVRLLGQAPPVEGSVVEPLAMGGLVDVHARSENQSTLSSAGPSTESATEEASTAFGTFTPEELAFAEHIVANASFPPATAPAVGAGASTFGYPPSPLELSPMDGLQSFDSPTGVGRFTFDFASSAPISSVPVPPSPDFAEFLNPFATAGEDDSPLAGFEFVSDGLAPRGSPTATRRGSSPMSDISYDSVSTVPTPDGVHRFLPSLSNTLGGCSSDQVGSGRTVGEQTGTSPSARWSTLPQQRVPSPLLLPSSNLALSVSPLPSSTSRSVAGRPLPALLRRTSSRPGSPMQISPPASPRTLPTLSTMTTVSASSMTPLPRPGTPTLLLRSTSTASLHPSVKSSTSTTPAVKQPTASTSTAPDCARSSRSALGRGSRHLQRVFSGTASTPGSAGPSTSSGPRSNASLSSLVNPSTHSSSGLSSARPPKPTRTNSSTSALRLSLPPKRPISPTELGALGLECLTDFMAQHSGSSSVSMAANASATGPGAGVGSSEKRQLAKQEFADLGLGGMGSPRSVGCY